MKTKTLPLLFSKILEAEDLLHQVFYSNLKSRATERSLKTVGMQKAPVSSTKQRRFPNHSFSVFYTAKYL